MGCAMRETGVRRSLAVFHSLSEGAHHGAPDTLETHTRRFKQKDTDPFPLPDQGEEEVERADAGIVSMPCLDPRHVQNPLEAG